MGYIRAATNTQFSRRIDLNINGFSGIRRIKKADTLKPPDWISATHWLYDLEQVTQTF